MNKVIKIVAEGPTEKAVIDKCMADLFRSNGFSLSVVTVGGNKYHKTLKNIVNFLKQGCFVTTIFDYYGLGSDWPGYTESLENHNPAMVEQALSQAVTECVGPELARRFVPYIQMYELEALLFAGPRQMAEVFGNEALQSEFEAIVAECDGCEKINNNQQTAPSKRIESIYSRYKKGLGVNAHAHQIVEKTGLEKIRNECPRFNQWIENLLSFE